MENKMFTISIDKEYNVFEKKFNNQIYLRVYTSLFQAGIVKELKPNNFTVLLAIASFMDAEGNCYPTQRQIVDITGISLPTVQKSIKELLIFKVNGVPVLERKLVQKGNFKSSYYSVNPVSQVAIFDGHIKEISQASDKDSLPSLTKHVVLNNTINNHINNNAAEEDKNSEITTAKQFIQYFSKRYKKRYGTEPAINWQRDMANVKRKLLSTYSSEQLILMVDTAIDLYDTNWKQDRYPRPTIGQLVSWLGEQAVAIAEDKNKELKELIELTGDSEEKNSNVLAKFGIKGGEGNEGN